jgi:hypothetical protein
MEKMKARQKSKDREIKEDDQNTTYFFAKANYRKRKKTVTCLEHNGETFDDNQSMIDHAASFYKTLFGSELK